jgi:hypothetical protein
MEVEILWGGTSQRLERTARPNSPLTPKGEYWFFCIKKLNE